jgi:hypothetical protein
MGRVQAALRIPPGEAAPDSDWQQALASQGVSLEEHLRERARAEIEACEIQREFLVSMYGEKPSHPVARAILRLADDAIRYYRRQARG